MIPETMTPFYWVAFGVIGVCLLLIVVAILSAFILSGRQSREEEREADSRIYPAGPRSLR